MCSFMDILKTTLSNFFIFAISILIEVETRKKYNQSRVTFRDTFTCKIATDLHIITIQYVLMQLVSDID